MTPRQRRMTLVFGIIAGVSIAGRLVDGHGTPSKLKPAVAFSSLL